MALHPGAAGVLLDSLRDASHRTQIIVTSHNPDLLDDERLDIESILAVVAVESLPVIERALVADWVDESVAGDWEDVQIEFGLKEQRETPRRSLWGPPPPPPERGFDISNVIAHQHKAKAKAQAKRKQEKKSRRKNRKR